MTLLRLLSGLAALLACVLVLGCGDDDSHPTTDAGGTVRVDSGGTTGTDSGGGGTSTVGMICASSTNCTGPGEVCCLNMTPYSCQLSTACPMMEPGGIPCMHTPDCPSGGNICCAVPGTMPFCTRDSACTSFGGSELP